VSIEIDREELFDLLDTSDWRECTPWHRGHIETAHVVRDGVDYVVTFEVDPQDADHKPSSRGIQDYGIFTLEPARSVTSVRWVAK
jgi:hypothetical protein